MRIHLIYNHTAGQRRGGLIDKVKKWLTARDNQLEITPTAYAGHAKDIAEEDLSPGTDMIAIAGGDGTVNEVANGLAPDGPPLLFIPFGTANVMKYELGYRGSRRKIIRSALASDRIIETRPMLINDRRTLLMASVGLDAIAVAEVSANLKAKIGPLAYVWSGLKALPRLKKLNLTVSIDGGAPLPAKTILLMRGRYYGGPFVMAHEADLSEPVFYLVLLNPRHIFDVLGYAARALFKRLHDAPTVTTIRATKAEITCDQPLPVQGDGDHIADLPITVRLDDEAWLLGLSGGLGAGYILYEFAKDHSAHLVLNLRYRWNYPMERFHKVAERTGLSLDVQETAGAAKAAANLDNAIENEQSPLVFLDWLHTPFLWAVEAKAKTAKGYQVQDLGAAYHIDPDYLAERRANTVSIKNRIMTAGKAKAPGKRAAQDNLKSAVADCADYLLANSDSFAIKAWKKWARLIVDPKHKKGWPNVLGDGSRLAEPLFMLHDRMLYTNSGGGGLRNLYADFLDQADGKVPGLQLGEAAANYRAAAKALDALAHTALPKGIAPFDEARKIMKRRYRALTKSGDANIKKVIKDNEAMADLRDMVNADPPLSKDDRLKPARRIQIGGRPMGRIIKWTLGIIALVIVLGIAAGYESDIPVAELEPKYMSDTSTYITLDNGLKVHMRDEGNPDGDVLVLIHGSNASLHTWEAWVERLEDDYRIISMDLAGHGLTGPHPDHDYSMPGQAALVHEVLTKLDVDSYSIAGSSMGGFVSWRHAVDYPDGVEKLIVIGSSGYPHPDADPGFLWSLLEMPGIRNIFEMVTPRSFVEPLIHETYGNSPVVDDAMIDRYWELILREGNRKATAVRRQEGRDMTQHELLKTLDKPTLVMWGANDPLVPVGDAHKFHRDLPDSVLVIYDDLAHIPFEEDAEGEWLMEHVWMLVLGLTVLLTGAVLLLPVASRLHIPYTVLLAIAGGIVGTLAIALGEPSATGDPHSSAGFFTDTLSALTGMELTSEVILFVFLPALVFESALSIDVRRLMDDIGPILFLAALGLLISAFTVGFVLHWSSGMAIIACLLLGAIVSATDPVAVVAIFKEVGAPKRLAILVEGESLFNDATAIVVFTILLGMLTSGADFGLASGIMTFLKVFIGGVLVGYVMARLACFLIARLHRLPLVAITLTITLAYLAFLIAEHYLHVSGVMAVVTAGLVIGSVGRTIISPHDFHGLHHTWEQIGFWANSIIFVLVGLAVPHLLADADPGLFLLIGLLIVTATLVRSAIVYGLVPALSRLGLGQTVSRSYQTIMVWGGLRGAVSLALALAIVENTAIDGETRQFIAVLVTGFVLFTLFVQATSIQAVMGWLGLNTLSPADQAIRDRTLTRTLIKVTDGVEKAAAQKDIDADLAAEITGPVDARRPVIKGDAVSDQEWQQVGLAMLIAREREAYLNQFGKGFLSAAALRDLLIKCDDMADALKAGGIEGYHDASTASLNYSRDMRIALWLQNKLRLTGPLSSALALRFEILTAAHGTIGDVLEEGLPPVQELVGSHNTDQIVEEIEERRQAVDKALAAIRLQYPDYAQAVAKRFLERVALRTEQSDYDNLLSQSLIGPQVHQDLSRDLEARSLALDTPPELDLGLEPDKLVAKVPLFDGLSPSQIQAIAALLQPRLAIPGEVICKTGETGKDMYFISSGAVEVLIGDHTIQLGSGDFFGEIAILQDRPRTADVVSMGVCQLLSLKRTALESLFSQDPNLEAHMQIADVCFFSGISMIENDGTGLDEKTMVEILMVSPFQRWLDLSLSDYRPDGITIAMPWKEDLVSNPTINSVHGGVLASLIDLTGYYALLQKTTRVKATADLRVDYHAPATQGTFYAKGRVLNIAARTATAAPPSSMISLDKSPTTTDQRLRGFWILFCSLMVIGMGQTLFNAILPPIGRDLGLSEVQVSAIFSLSAFIWVFMSPIWGKQSDKLGRKPIILIGLLGYGASTGLFGLVILGALNEWFALVLVFPLLMGARAIFGTFGSATMPAAQAYIADRTTRMDRSSGVARIGASFQVGTIIGPGIAAALVVFGILTPFFVVSGLAIAGVLAILFFLPEKATPEIEANRRRGMTREGLKATDRRIVPFLVMSIAMSFTQAVLFHVTAFYFMDELKVSSADTAQLVGVGFMALAMAALFAQLFIIQTFKPSVQFLLRAGTMLLIAGYGLLVLGGAYGVMVAGLVLVGMGMGMFGPGMQAAGSLSVQPHEQGAVAGWIGSTNAVGHILNPVVGMPLYYLMQEGPYLFAMTLLAGCCLYAWFSPRIRAIKADVEIDEEEVEVSHPRG
ncbi:apnhaP [Symbiodinium microadriaticum]|nr:apnhaP [Symbiodinium microadriaticum]